MHYESSIGHNKDKSHPVHPVCPPLSWDTAILGSKCMYSRSAASKKVRLHPGPAVENSSLILRDMNLRWEATMNQRSSCQSHTCKYENFQFKTGKHDLGEIFKKRTMDLDDWMERENHHIKITNSRPGWGFWFLLCCQHLFRYSYDVSVTKL